MPSRPSRLLPQHSATALPSRQPSRLSTALSPALSHSPLAQPSRQPSRTALSPRLSTALASAQHSPHSPLSDLEISRLRYELCPRVMKERRFWKIYFTLVNSHVAPFEKQYMEELKLKEAEDLKDDKVKQASGENEKAEGMEKSLKGQTSNASAEQDLDKFLLGDLEDSDGGADDGEESFDDDFDKIGNSDVEDEAQMKKAAAARG